MAIPAVRFTHPVVKLDRLPGGELDVYRLRRVDVTPVSVRARTGSGVLGVELRSERFGNVTGHLHRRVPRLTVYVPQHVGLVAEATSMACQESLR